MKRLLAAAVSISLLAVASDRAVAECKLVSAVIPVTMEGLRPMISAQINGIDEKFIADSGAFFNLITPASAAELKLSLRRPPIDIHLSGVGGTADVFVTTVKTFTIAGVPLHRVDFIVGGGQPEGDAAGLIGQNIFHLHDVEYDLAHSAIRLVKPDGCRNSPLAYWATAQQPYSQLSIGFSGPSELHTIGMAYVNGAQIRVEFDTGSPLSTLSLRAAEKAGVRPDQTGVVSAGTTFGIGRNQIQTWIAPFSDFKIGDEEIRNTRLRFGDIGLSGADMLLGTDFFLSHRIYVANSQGKLYFTYNGGPVFNLQVARGGTSSAAATESAQPDASPAESASAEDLAQRARVEAARGDLEHAIDDFTRALALRPQEAQYFYERGVARARSKQMDDALADFEQAVKLRPGDVPALLRLAEMRLAAHDNAEAITSLDSVDRLAPKEADLRLELARLYARLARYDQTVAQYDLWIAVHREDARMPEALGGRCRARALIGQDLGKALDDCDAALRREPKNATYLDSRGLTRLRQGKFDRAISDYDASLKARPANAESLYGRGLAELRASKREQGRADMDAAQAIAPHIADAFSKLGLSP